MKYLKFSIDNRGNAKANFEECNFKDDLTAKKCDDCNITLKTICFLIEGLKTFLIDDFSTPFRLDRDSKGGGDHVICKSGYTL